MSKTLRGPQIRSIRVREEAICANTSTSRASPALLFPDWTILQDHSTDVEQAEKYTTGCWPIPTPGRSILSNYDIIDEQLKGNTICGAKPKPGVSIVWQAMRNAQRRIYLFDDNIGPEEFCRFLQILKQREKRHDALPIKFLLLTNLANKETKSTISQLYNYVESCFSKTQLTVLPTKMNHFLYIHDRFALIDDAVWHFGATIGAMHRSYNAFSGPWYDKNNAMSKFFHFLAKAFATKAYIGVPFESNEEENGKR